MNVYWVKLRSWHAVDTFNRSGETKTRCGRYTFNVQQDERPGGERTCETCLRIVAPK